MLMLRLRPRSAARVGEVQAALALTATVVGAGFASGREIVRFFTQYGVLSWAGCILSAMALTALAALAARLAGKLGARDLATLATRALGGMVGWVGVLIHGTLVITTAGAMVAAMGELAALALPVRHAWEIGVLIALFMGCWMARKGIAAIAAVGGWLMPACLLLYALLLGLPKEATEHAPAVIPRAWAAMPLALAYAAMNAALGCGVLCEVGRARDTGSILRVCALTGGMLLSLLLLANAALGRHLALVQGEALPVVALARSLGATGYWLCLVTLLLAVFSTLVALLRTLLRMLEEHLPAPAVWPVTVLAPLGAGMTGFGVLVGTVYPILGVASTVVFLAMIASPLITPLKERIGTVRQALPARKKERA